MECKKGRDQLGSRPSIIEIDALGFAAGPYVLVAVIQDGVEYLHRGVAVKFEVSRAAQEKDIYGVSLVAIGHRWLEAHE